MMLVAWILASVMYAATSLAWRREMLRRIAAEAEVRRVRTLAAELGVQIHTAPGTARTMLAVLRAAAPAGVPLSRVIEELALEEHRERMVVGKVRPPTGSGTGSPCSVYVAPQVKP